MTCSYCQLAGCCSGIGACAANQKYLKAYLQRHPGKIVSGNLARQICNLGKREEDAGKLKEIKESLYSLAEQKQTDLFRMAYAYLCNNNYFHYFHINTNNTNNYFAVMIAFKMVLSKTRYNEYIKQIEDLFDELSKDLSTIPIRKIRNIMGIPNNWRRLKTLN